jgi:hypothetical protein
MMSWIGAMKRPNRIQILILPALLTHCGVAPSKGLPPNENALSSMSINPKAVQLEKLWIDFTSELRLNYRSPFPDLQSTELSKNKNPPPNSSKTTQDLRLELEDFPGVLDDANYEKLNADLVKAFSQAPSSDELTASSTTATSPFNATRCARIERVSEVSGISPYAGEKTTPLSGIKILKLEYVLQNESPAKSLGLLDGSFGDQIVRTALVTVPDQTVLAGKKIPLAIYGHGGDSGLSYSELAKVFGQRQKEFVIAAPAFPDEPICESGLNPLTLACNGQTIAKPAGTLRPFDTDANEILGLHHCIVRALYGVSSNTTVKSFGLPTELDTSDNKSGKAGDTDSPVNPTFSTLLAETLSTYGEKGQGILGNIGTRNTDEILRTAHPKSVMFGSSRGSAAALIALAKTAAAYSAFRNSTETKSFSLFQCGAFLFPPTTFAMGKLRIGLELFVKGLSESSVFYQLPTAPLLAEFFRDFREGNKTAQQMALKYAQIDPLLNVHLIASALRNWSDPEALPGKLLLLHGRLDRVVGSENSRYFGNMMSKASARISQEKSAPGAISSIISFAPPTDTPFPTGSIFGDLVYQHGDNVFQKSQSVADNATAATLNPANGQIEDAAWNIVSESKHPEFLDRDFMNESGRTPEDTLTLWLTNSCLQN